jgi:putative hemin transport protein
MTPLEPEIAEAIRDSFRLDRSRMTMMAARQFGVPERAVVEALRDAPDLEGPGAWSIKRLRDDAFRDLMDALPEFGPLRVFVRSRAAVLEVVGQFGGYSETGPFFNVQTDVIDMHIIPEEIAALYAVEKWGHDTEFVTHSFQLFDRHGDAALKAFLWDNFPDVPESRVDAFRSLAGRLAVRGDGTTDDR